MQNQQKQPNRRRIKQNVLQPKTKKQDLAAACGVRSIPTLLFCPMEGAPQVARGALPKASFEEAIKDVLKVEK